MEHNLLIKDHLTEASEEKIRKLGIILGPTQIVDLETFKKESFSADIFIICTQISERSNLDHSLIFWKSFLAQQTLHPVILICITYDASLGIEWFDKILPYFKDPPIVTQEFPDHISLFSVVEFALTAKILLESHLEKQMPKEDLYPLILNFLKNHNTCTLSTGFGSTIRGTPIEYIFLSDTFYFLSEGGEKFANIFRNSHVAITVYDNFTSMENLASFQFNGYAELIETNSEEYLAVLNSKGLKPESLWKLGIQLIMFKVPPKKVEILYYKCRELGFNQKQVYNY